MRAALAVALATAFSWLLLRAESQRAIAALIVLAVVAGVLIARFRPLRASGPERLTDALAAGAVVVLALLLRDDDFSLLLITRILIVIVACLGLNVQFGYAGVVNFAGASFFGVGGYTAAVLSRSTGLPHLLVLLCGGFTAALAGLLLVLPLLRTRGHYAALITIATSIPTGDLVDPSNRLGGVLPFDRASLLILRIVVITKDAQGFRAALLNG